MAHFWFSLLDKTGSNLFAEFVANIGPEFSSILAYMVQVLGALHGTSTGGHSFFQKRAPELLRHEHDVASRCQNQGKYPGKSIFLDFNNKFFTFDNFIIF